MDPRIQGVDVIITRCESTISLLTLVSLLAGRLIALHQSSRAVSLRIPLHGSYSITLSPTNGSPGMATKYGAAFICV